MICSNCKADVSDDSLYCGKCGQSLIGSDLQITRNDFTQKLNNTKILDFKNGESFGERYKMISVLGKGGMGQVFKAHDSVLDIDVALKMIRPEFLMNKKMISRFKQEILLAREITHENVSRIYDFGEVDGTKFISMEFISGRTLKDIVKNDGPSEIEKAIKISKAICNGLSAAHKKEIIHRDLKPQNIMIDENDHVYITDFGLAKSIKEENVSHTGLVIGTPQYIPPELWKGEVADKRSDIYSLGIIMYEMVTGEELFQSDSDYGYLQKHVNEEPEFPDEIIDKLPSFYNNVILKCLFKDRAKRYQDCSDIYRDLEDKVYTKGTLISELERSIKKTGLLKIGLFIGLILLISFFGSMILKKGPPVQKKRSVAILYFKNLSGMKDLDHYSYSLPELLATDLGQSKYIRVLSDDKVSEVLKEKNYLSSNIFDQKFFETIGDEANVNYLIQGSFIRSGEDLRISVKLRDSDTGEMLSTDYVDASADNIFPAIDRLTTGLKRRFDLSESEILADIDNNIEDITTSSPEALNHYIRGKKLFNNNNFTGSIIEFKKAVSIDPEFAMAYRDIAWSYAYLNDYKNRKKYFEKTILYINRLSEREKLLISADYYGEEFSTFNKSLESYNKLLKIYPDDIYANLESGFFYTWFEEWDKAISRYNNVSENDSSNVIALNGLVNCYSGKGNYAEAEKLISDFEKIYPGNNREAILGMKFRLNILQRKFDLALKVVNEEKQIGSLNDQDYHFSINKLDLLNENTINSRIEYEKLLKFNNGKIDHIKISNLEFMFLFNGHYSIALKILDDQINNLEDQAYVSDAKFKIFFIMLRSGDKKWSLKAIKEFNEKLSVKSTANIYKQLFLTGLANINLGRLKESEEFAVKIKNLSEISLFKKQITRLYFLIIAKIERSKLNYDKSIEYLKEGSRFLSFDWGGGNSFYEINPFYYYELGLTNFLMNKSDESEKWFKKIGDLTFCRYYFGDLYAKSFYYLGKIYQKKGWTGKAIESYNNFILMWGNGDKEIVGKMINDAIKQVKLLETKI